MLDSARGTRPFWVRSNVAVFGKAVVHIFRNPNTRIHFSGQHGQYGPGQDEHLHIYRFSLEKDANRYLKKSLVKGFSKTEDPFDAFLKHYVELDPRHRPHV